MPAVPGGRGAHRHQLLGAAGVQRHGLVEVALGHAHAHQCGDDLHGLGRIRAQQLHTQHLVGTGIDEDFLVHAFLRARQRGLERTETGAVDIDQRITLDGLLLVEPHGAQLRCREDGGRDEVQIGHPGLFAEGGVGKGMALADGHRGQRHGAGDIAHRVDARHIGAREPVDDDLALFAGFHAHVLQAEVARGRTAAGGDQHLVHVECAVIVQGDADAAVGLAVQPLEGGVHPHVDALLAVGLDDQVGHLHIETAQHARPAVDLCDLCAQPAEDAGKFDADVASPHHGDATGKLGQIEHLVGADGQFHAGQVVRHHRLTARGNENVPAADGFPAVGRGDFQLVGAQEAGVTGKTLDTGLVEVARIGPFQAGDFGILGGHQFLPVEMDLRHFPAEAAAFGKTLRKA